LSKSASLPAEPFENPQRENAQLGSATPSWKQEVNQRLAAHRTRRGGPQDAAESGVNEIPRSASSRAAEAAARVAARYAKAPSYSELLAGEARAVVRAAGAAAEAARNAQAAAQAVLEGLESGLESGLGSRHDSGPAATEFWEPAGRAVEVPAQAAQHPASPRWQDEPPVQAPAETRQSAWAGAQPRWEEGLPVRAADRDVWSEMRVHPSAHAAQDYRRDMEEGELFPLDAVASATVEPVQHLPANLIEFPRELVAARKARPRLAEGPFYSATQESPQLNIFEVDPVQLAAAVHPVDTRVAAVAPPEWASIELDHHPEPVYAEAVYPAQAYAHAPEALASVAEASAVQEEVEDRLETAEKARVAVRAPEPKRKQVQPPASTVADVAPVELLVASISDRMLAAVVDGALVTLAYLGAAVVVIASTTHPPTGRIALIASGCGLVLFGLLYQFLFLSYAEEGTPGMRYARIALCTFDDENPTVDQMRMRIPALLLATLPAALGLLWALFDKEHLGWQDRLTKTYQRKY